MMSISVITPTYNLENYIQETYGSLKKQSYTDWEWIIVDDDSTDKTLEIIRGWSDKRITVIESAHTGNLAILRNIGARVAKGEYLAFVDGDDICESDKFRSQIALSESNPEITWSHTNTRILTDATGVISNRTINTSLQPIMSPDMAFGSLAYRNFICISTVLVKRSVFEEVGGFDERFDRCEDINLWLRLAARGHSLGYIETPLLRYRVRASGLYESRTIEYLQTNFKVYEDVRKKFPDLYQRHRANINAHLANINMKIGIRLLAQSKVGHTDYFRSAFQMDRSVKKLGWLLLTSISPALVRRYLNQRYR